MSNRIVLNTISYHGKGAINEIPAIIKARGFEKAFVCTDPDLVKFGVSAKVTDLLDAAGVAYEEDETLVRGLDYYTRTVFEVQVSTAGNNQNAIGGGGRYDKLMSQIGGADTPGFGFALGYERCRMALEACGAYREVEPSLDLFVACVEDGARSQAFALAQECRDAGLRVEIDHQGRSLKSQFKLADKLGALHVAVLGPDELAEGACTLRDMATRDEVLLPLADLAQRLQS